MSESLVQLLTSGLWLSVLLGAPVLLVAVVASLVTTWLQARLGITDSSLPVAVRLLLGLTTLIALGPYVSGRLLGFATQVWSSLPNVH